eukprot:jgi/Galph1/5872/GphlegSOOS_G4524.1
MNSIDYCRAFNIFPLSWLLNRYRMDKISLKNQFIMWFSGLRGAIAFALSLNFPDEEGSSDVRKAIISTTLSIVLFTVIVLGGGTMPVLRLLGVEGADAESDVVHSRFIDNEEENHFESTETSPNGFKEHWKPLHQSVSSEERDPSSSCTSHADHVNVFPVASHLNFFHYLDNRYLKPCFRVAHTRTGEATERALRRIASTRGRYLTPHEIGSYLEAAAEEVSTLYSPVAEEPLTNDTFQVDTEDDVWPNDSRQES